MPIAVFGLNHNTAPIEVRERLFVSEETIPRLVRELQESGVDENIVLSTCNRTEFYFSCKNLDSALDKFYQALSRHFSIEKEWLEKYTYLLTDEDTYRHLFLVASGLDSMVVGEPQILGQVKDAYRLATDCNTSGFFLDKVFHKTFNVAKRIRTETKVGYNPVSISAMAIELAKKIFGELKDKKTLVIGAGEMCEIALRYFKKEGVGDIYITNRTFHNAQKLADETTGIPRPFNDLQDLLEKVDMILSSTGSERPLISRELVSVVMKKRKQKPLFFIDIAVPRDIEPSVNNLENVYLYDIDDLKELSQQHLSDRLAESEKARSIVDEEVKKFSQWLRQLDKNPLISNIYEKVEEIRSRELKKILQKNKNTDDETMKNMDLLTKSIVNKLVHPHVTMIKENGSPAILELMKKLFRLEDDDEQDVDSWHKG
ncbi:MAG TPA: glutamyl-tRNA reductase [Syntrophorhabdus sp.]|nr:glutamyl-tRNA reductase [Syntrophorhabdus sp.]